MVEERRVRNSTLFLSESGSYVCFFAGEGCLFVGIITVAWVRDGFDVVAQWFVKFENCWLKPKIGAKINLNVTDITKILGNDGINNTI